MTTNPFADGRSTFSGIIILHLAHSCHALELELTAVNRPKRICGSSSPVKHSAYGVTRPVLFLALRSSSMIHLNSWITTTSECLAVPGCISDKYTESSFAAELLVGLWRTYSSLDPTISASGITHLPSPARMILPHCPAGKWNDYAKMNSFLSRAIFPSMSYEYQTDFLDRVDTARAFVFERVVFADRAAAFRGPQFSKTWRTASEAVTLHASRYWWTPVRKNLLEFVGGGKDDSFMDEILGVGHEEEEIPSEMDLLALEAEEGAMEEELQKEKEQSQEAKKAKMGKPVITYVSRQEWGRRMLKSEGHESLVTELKELEKKYGWEVSAV